MSSLCCSLGFAELTEGELPQNEPQTYSKRCLTQIKNGFLPFAVTERWAGSRDLCICLRIPLRRQSRISYLQVGTDLSSPSTPSEGFNEKTNPWSNNHQQPDMRSLAAIKLWIQLQQVMNFPV